MKLVKMGIAIFVAFICLAFFNACSNASTNSNASTSSNDQTIEVRPPQWTEDLEYQIKKAYYKTLFTDDANFDINEISMAYYGSYSGYEAVLNTGIGAAMVTPVEVGGHLFNFGTTNVILLYKNDTFIEFQIAFDEGKITQEDIDRLYEIYMSAP